MTVIALGWKEKDPGDNTTPRVLYCGGDMDEAIKVINAAGKSKAIRLGQIVRGIEDRVVHRAVFE